MSIWSVFTKRAHNLYQCGKPLFSLGSEAGGGAGIIFSNPGKREGGGAGENTGLTLLETAERTETVGCGRYLLSFTQTSTIFGLHIAICL